jgi:hypothetical protein
MRIHLWDRQSVRWFAPLITDLRQQHLAEGGDPVDFPVYLNDNGIHTVGIYTFIPDSVATYAELKFG